MAVVVAGGTRAAVLGSTMLALLTMGNGGKSEVTLG